MSEEKDLEVILLKQQVEILKAHLHANEVAVVQQSACLDKLRETLGEDKYGEILGDTEYEAVVRAFSGFEILKDLMTTVDNPGLRRERCTVFRCRYCDEFYLDTYTGKSTMHGSDCPIRRAELWLSQ
jgi:hypothetical protein